MNTYRATIQVENGKEVHTSRTFVLQGAEEFDITRAAVHISRHLRHSIELIEAKDVMTPPEPPLTLTRTREEVAKVIHFSAVHDLANALQTLLKVQLKGHSLRDHLQFSESGRLVAKMCDEALKGVL
jgi:hypothetical protein